MLPARQQKIDTSKLSEDELKKFRQYGVLPSNKNLLSQRIKERKYFDSGDYALSRAGKSGTTVGEKHPSPDSIPHQHQLHNPSHATSSTIGNTSFTAPLPAISVSDPSNPNQKAPSPPTQPPNSQLN